MSDYENELALWGLSIHDPYGAGLHARIAKLNAVHAKQTEFNDVKLYFDQCKERVENSWTAKNFQDYTDASWKLKVCKEELDALMKQ
jgi:hypothetical protein